ncbi:MAG: hypothetical protein AB1540_04105 [Bdellovibrionota bacterium]
MGTLFSLIFFLNLSFAGTTGGQNESHSAGETSFYQVDCAYTYTWETKAELRARLKEEDLALIASGGKPKCAFITGVAGPEAMPLTTTPTVTAKPPKETIKAEQEIPQIAEPVIEYKPVTCEQFSNGYLERLDLGNLQKPSPAVIKSQYEKGDSNFPWFKFSFIDPTHSKSPKLREDYEKFPEHHSTLIAGEWGWPEPLSNTGQRIAQSNDSTKPKQWGLTIYGHWEESLRRKNKTLRRGRLEKTFRFSVFENECRLIEIRMDFLPYGNGDRITKSFNANSCKKLALAYRSERLHEIKANPNDAKMCSEVLEHFLAFKPKPAGTSYKGGIKSSSLDPK